MPAKLTASDSRSLTLGAVVVLLMLALLGGTAVAAKQYVLRHPKREHCKAHYVKKTKTIKKHEHGRIVKVHEILCVYVAPKIITTTTATPATTASTPTAPDPAPTPRVVSLHAHLDPSSIQSPTNPLVITYRYSASATVGSESEPNLPAGLLSLYANGSLACSMKVGGSTIGGECQVAYATTGPQTVVVTYSSGLISASEAYKENVEPFTTHTSIEEANPIECNKEEKLSPLGASTTKSSWCRYVITIITANKFGVTPPKKGIWLTFPDGAGYHPFEDNIEIGKLYEAVLTLGEIFGLKEIKESESCILKIGGNIYVIKEVSNCHHLPIVASYNGNELVGGGYSWLGSETEFSLED